MVKGVIGKYGYWSQENFQLMPGLGSANSLQAALIDLTTSVLTDEWDVFQVTAKQRNETRVVSADLHNESVEEKFVYYKEFRIRGYKNAYDESICFKQQLFLPCEKYFLHRLILS